MPNKFKTSILSLLIFILLLTINNYPQSFLITKYSTDNGLPDNRVNDIAQDSLGRMWVAMVSGIAMYDGYEWTKFGENDGVPEIEYKRIKVDEKGVIWFMPTEVLNHAIVKNSNRKWTAIKFEQSVFNKINALNSIEVRYINRSPELLISSVVGGLFKYFNGFWTNISQKNGLLSDTLTNVKMCGDKILIANLKGLSIINSKNKIENFSLVSKFRDSRLLGISSCEENNFSKHSRILLGINWIAIFDGEQITKISDKFNLSYAGLNDQISVNFVNKEKIIFGSTSTLYIYSFVSKKLDKLILDTPTSDRGATSIFKDYEGNIWISSLRGIYKLTIIPFENYSKKTGLLEDEVCLVSCFNSGLKIFGHNYGITFETKASYNKIKFNDPVN